MFILHSSNRTENLLEHLVIVLKSAPLCSPFTEELLLIQSQGMERWLSQQLAEHFKVCGNFRYLFPGKFFSSLTGRLLESAGDAAFDRQLLLWRIEVLLRNVNAEVFKPLQNYLSGGNIDLKRYQLALQLTKVFDQYQMLRPDLLEAWRQGRCLYDTDNEHWQRAVWQSLCKDIGTLHRGEIWRQIIARLQQHPPGYFTDALPERVSVFGVNTMPPLLLAYLQALSRHCDIHLYLLNPVQGYWADLPGRRLQTQLAEFEGHPLLVSLGRQGREFQQLLLEQVEFQFEPSSFQADIADNNLKQLQNDILANITPQTKLQADKSISIHACHSRFREVQVLKNQLLAALEAHPDLDLRDIIVMAPDIQLYAPFINAVFADIHHAIADRSLRISNTALNLLISFLSLSQSRLGWQSVLDLLEQPLVYSSFGLIDADLELIRYWIKDTHVRWGKSAAHKQALDLPALNQNTWNAALQRLFMGYAVGSDEDFVEGILPYTDIEGASSQILGGLNDFLQLLFKAGDEFKTEKLLSEWQNLLKNYADKLLSKAAPLERQPLNELLAEIDDVAALHGQPVTMAVMLAWLEGRMDESKSSNGFLRGQLTFCSMLPMRTIPFQVIALLGLNDGEFPKIERSPSFDLLAQHPRLGDRSRRADDRYQFLEILLSARRQLIITYIGLSQRDNSVIPPSVIINELLTVLQDCYQLSDPVIRHPLHPFSPRYFNNSKPELFSFSESDHFTASRLSQEKPEILPIEPWWQGSLDIENGEPISLEELQFFFNHPQRFFLRQILGVELPLLDTDPEEREPFALDTLSNYSIQQQWLAETLNTSTPPLAKLQAQGLWPPGALGEVEWRRQQPNIQRFVENIKSRGLGLARPALSVDLSLGPYRLIGKLEHVYDNGSLLYRYSTLKGKDFIAAWLHHLLINTLQPQTTYLLARDKDLIFQPEIANKEFLTGLIEIFLQGKQTPDAFFTEAAFCYLQQKNPATALNTVIRHMLDSIEKGYEPEIGHLLAGRDLNGIFNQRFAEQCQTLLYPAWKAAHGD